MFFKKLFSKKAGILHRTVIPLNEGDLYKTRVINGNLEMAGFWNFDARKLKRVNENLVIFEGANLVAPKLKKVVGKIFARDIAGLDLPMLTSAYAIYISNVTSISLPRLKNCTIYIDKTYSHFPFDVDPSVQIVHSTSPLDTKTINISLENFAAARRTRTDKVR